MDQSKVVKAIRRMTEARASIIRDNPFFGHLSMRMQLACAPCRTACTDGSRLIFDPEFAEKLSDREMQFVTLHEVLHCVLGHCSRGRSLDSVLFNISCDIVVNSTILDMWGLDSFKIAGEEVMHLAPDGKNGLLYNAEEIYHMMMQEKSNDPKLRWNTLNIGKGNDSGIGDALSEDKHVTGNAKRGNLAGSEEQNQQVNPSDVSSFDRHDLWQGICNKTQLRDDWNGRIRNAIKDCGDSTGMPQSIRRVVQKLTDRINLDWKQLLHDFLQYDLYDYTFIPPDHRYTDAGFYLPAFNEDENDGSANDIWVCVDTSASISDKQLACAMAEILDAMRQVRLMGKISFFDSSITDPEPFDTEDEIKKITPSGGGGTSFQIIFKYLQERMYPELPKAILIFTDGYAKWPKEQDALGVPVLWLISKDGKDDISWGRVMKL